MRKIRKRSYLVRLGWDILEALPKTILKLGKYTVENSEITFDPKTQEVVWRFKKTK